MTRLAFLLTATCFFPPAFAQERILFVTAEQSGVFNTGGLGHTTSSLARALNEAGESVEVVMPYYSTLDSTLKGIKDEKIRYSFRWGQGEGAESFRFGLFSTTNPRTGTRTYLLKPLSHPELFENAPPPGTPTRYTNYSSEGKAFAAFNQAAAEFAKGRDYTLVNTHDWHAGLFGRFAREGGSDVKILFTISNLGYQGLTDFSAFGPLFRDSEKYPGSPYEFHGRFNFMKAGVHDADAVLTVSPGYLADIQTPRFGHGLDGFLRAESKRKPLLAILNGTDLANWRPTDFSAESLDGKRTGKLELQTLLGLDADSERPLFCLTSRLAHQKGYDYLPGALRKLLDSDKNAQIVVMGDGDARYVEAIERVRADFPQRFIYRPFSAELEIPMTRYSDFFVNAAWYEPSGTNQIFALANGTLPLLSRTGGLPDYVIEGKTGFLYDIAFHDHSDSIDVRQSERNVGEALIQAAKDFRERPKAHSDRVRAALSVDHSWKAQIPRYREVFRITEESRLKRFGGSGCKTALKAVLDL